MRLNPSHRHELWSIGMRGLATLIAVLLFWGTTAPMMFGHGHHVSSDSSDDQQKATSLDEASIYKLSRFSGVSATIVLIGCFQSSYTNLLTPKLSIDERKYGFAVFWFIGSIFFNLVWQLPYWGIPIMHRELSRKTFHGFYWKIVWWSYTLFDEWYDHLTKLVIAFEIWWLLGNVVGVIGLYYAYKQHQTDVSGSKDKQLHQQVENYYYRRALICFSICGALQAYNASIYLFLSGYLSSFEHVPNDPLSMSIFWGLNGFWAIASAVASYFACSLLLPHRDSSSSLQHLSDFHKSKTM